MGEKIVARHIGAVDAGGGGQARIDDVGCQTAGAAFGVDQADQGSFKGAAAGVLAGGAAGGGGR